MPPRIAAPRTSECSRLVRDAGGLNSAAWPVPPDQLVTPTDCFFTRSHASIPRIDASAWRLEVDGLVRRPLRFSLAELIRAFPRRTVAATLVCAGLRRDELLSVAPIPGELPWGAEPASTGHWSGVALADLLEEAGVGENARHVEAVGLDQVERLGRRFGFGGSIGLTKALDRGVLLADELNGAPLSLAHGFPLRLVVPGWIGARSVKWLSRITLREEPSSNYFQERAYRLLRQAGPSDPRDVMAGVALDAVPLNSVILHPTRDTPVPAGALEIGGWAMGPGGGPIRSVEVSLDGGDWRPATLREGASSWTWVLWQFSARVAPGEHVVAVRATDLGGATQPESLAEMWNVKGYNNHAWHQVRFHAR